MGAVVLDTSVVIGFLQPTDAHHHSALRAISGVRERGHQFILPASVLAEVLVGEYRSAVGDATRLGDALLALFGPERVIDANVARAAARVRATHRSLRLPDALVIGTAVVDDTAVLTCDRRLAAVDKRVRLLDST